MVGSGKSTAPGTTTCGGNAWDLSGVELLSCEVLGCFAPLTILLAALERLPARLLRLAVTLVVKVLYRVHIVDPHHVPAKGGALLVANHVSWVDAVLLSIYSPRSVRMLGLADYFQRWPWSWIAREAGVILIKPGGGRRSILASLAKTREALAAGELVCIFPEGAITRDGRIAGFKPGFLGIARGTGAKVIPVYLEGLWGSIFSYRWGESFLKRPRRWPYPVAIRYGRPLDNPQRVEEAREAVLALAPELIGELAVAQPASAIVHRVGPIATTARSEN